MRRFRRFTRDAPTPRTRVVVNAIDFRGKRVAEAMVIALTKDEEARN